MATTITTATAKATSVAATMPATSNSSTLLFQTAQRTSHQAIGLCSELGRSTEVIFRTKLIWMLALGPLAILADFSGMVSDTVCFCFAGLALIPCAERLSFVTEQVAIHTNGTIGGLLNATFGNAPELLIATAALRSGYYRVVQLAMLGSMLTNMLLVFGIACAIGGARWQVQELRTTSGNANVVMLYVAVAGCLFPAALRLSGQYNSSMGLADVTNDSNSEAEMQISPQEVTFCRVNAFVLFSLYLCFMIFQLGTHRDEFADDGGDGDHDNHHHSDNTMNQTFSKRNRRFAKRNESCRWFGQYIWRCCRTTSSVTNTTKTRSSAVTTAAASKATAVEHIPFLVAPWTHREDLDHDHDPDQRCHASVGNNDAIHGAYAPAGHDDQDDDNNNADEYEQEEDSRASFNGNATHNSVSQHSFDSTHNLTMLSKRRKRGRRSGDTDKINNNIHNDSTNKNTVEVMQKSDSKRSDLWETLSDVDSLDGVEAGSNGGLRDTTNDQSDEEVGDDDESPQLSLRMAIAWLLILTLCISSISDILVDTIDGFAKSMRLSEVFTSMVIIPFFSNVGEQVSAFIFAYRNEMDLCVAVTIGSAVQIATFVLPGSVLIGMTLDRNMTLYFGAYETCCLFFSVVVVGAVLQSGTSNWLTGAMLVGTYLIFASGVWFHELEQLTVDGEMHERGESNEG